MRKYNYELMLKIAIPFSEKSEARMLAALLEENYNPTQILRFFSDRDRRAEGVLPNNVPFSEPVLTFVSTTEKNVKRKT